MVFSCFSLIFSVSGCVCLSVIKKLVTITITTCLPIVIELPQGEGRLPATPPAYSARAKAHESCYHIYPCKSMGANVPPSARPTVQPMHDRTLHGGSTHIPEVFFCQIQWRPKQKQTNAGKTKQRKHHPPKKQNITKKTNQRTKIHIKHCMFDSKCCCAWPSLSLGSDFRLFDWHRPLPTPRLNSKSGEISNETHENQWYLVTGHSKKAQLNNYQVLDFQDLAKSWIAKTWFYIYTF